MSEKEKNMNTSSPFPDRGNNTAARSRILIAEDEIVIAMDLQSRLQDMGYEVPFIADSGENAVQKAYESAPDLVLMDIMLPGKMDGIEAAEQIRFMNNIPVIYLSASADEEVFNRAKLTEPFGYLIKPVENKELKHAIEITLVKHRTEKQLRAAVTKAIEEEAKTKAIIEGTGCGIIIRGTDYKIIYQNDIQSRIYGICEGELCYRVYEERDTVCDDCPVEISIRDGMVHKTERSITADGVIKHYELTSSPLKNSKGDITAGIKIIRDITERKKTEDELLRHREKLSVMVEEKTAELTSAVELLQNEILDRRHAEEALRQSEQRYRELFNYMSSGVAVYKAEDDGQDFIFKDINRSGEWIDKVRKEEIIDRRITDVFPGIREMGLLDALKRVWMSGKPEHHPVLSYKDERISGWRDNHIYKLPSGQVVAIYDDISEKVRSAERESNLLRELKTIFENFPVGIIYLDSEFRILSTNKFFTDFSGFQEGELTGKICYEVVGEYSNDPGRKGTERICSFCKKKESFRHRTTTTMERPFGNKFIRVTTVPELSEDGKISRFMEIVEDITERKRAEAEVIRAGHLASLGELAAGVAHEINNPINGIINYTQIIANNSTPGSKEHDIAHRIIKEGDRIAGIVSNLLSFARYSKEDKTMARISNILSEALGLTETQIKRDGIKLAVDIRTELPPILAQPQQLTQVFLNIISNARYALNMKYRGEHDNKLLEITGKRITVRERPCVHIIFHDRGTGIPSHIMDKIMNPFFSTKPSNIGTGLGLSISHGIISDHGGRLLIDSVEGEFTEVVVELPE